MAWNEPGGGKDPWGNRGNNDGPPDLDELIKSIQDKISRFFGGGPGGSGSSGGSSGLLFVLLLVIAAVVYVVAGMGVVNEQERVVVLRLGEYKETKLPGFRWNPPLIDKVFPVNVTKVKEFTTTEQMLTQDLNIVNIKISVQYVISDAHDFVLKVRDPEASLQEATNSALRHVTGSTMMHDVLTEGREQLAVEVQSRLQSYVDNYGTGIHIETVNIEDSNPPDEVQGSFDDVIKAREDEERFQNEAQAYANSVIPQARGKAQRTLEEATAYKQRVIAHAEGEAKHFNLLLTEYHKAPKVTRERLYLDAIQDVLQNSSKVMVDVDKGSNMIYLPLDKMISGEAAAASGKDKTTIDVPRLTDAVIQELQRRQSNNPRSSSSSSSHESNLRGIR